MATDKKRDSWSNNFGFIMAAAGAAIGLGNIWRFPYTCGENGGGAFLIVYLACVFLIGLPVLIAELLIGRHAQRAGAGAFSQLVKKRKKFWRYVGFVGILTGFLITSYYTIIAGWTLEYLWQSISGGLVDLNGAEASEAFFKTFMESDQRQIFWHVVFTLITIVILMGGVSGGIEKVAELLMPILLFILIGLAFYGLNLESNMAKLNDVPAKALEFLFQPKWEQFTRESMFQALGQAAFSLSIAVGTMVAYGSYLDKKENLSNLGAIVVVMDTMVGILGGLVIFPIVFAFGLNPEAGTGLIFVTLPALFNQIPGGTILAPSFYILLFFAALTSSISLLEPAVSHMVDEMKYHRIPAVILAGSASIILGIVWILTGSLEMDGLFTNIDKFISNLIVPLMAILIAVFVGWFVDKRISRKQLSQTPLFLYQVFIFLVKWVCPLVVGIILIRGLPI